MTPGDRFWTSRLHWRLHGAMQWPAFALFTIADALVLDALPPISTADGTGLNLIEGLLIATFGNLVLVGAVAPWLARRLVGRLAAPTTVDASPPPAIERAVVKDRIAVAVLAVGLAGVIASGLANRPVIVSDTDATEANAEALSRYVAHSGDEELVRNRDTANTIRLGEGYFRNCIARDDRERHFCVFIDTREDPPEVVVDDSAEPNTVYRGR